MPLHEEKSPSATTHASFGLLLLILGFVSLRCDLSMGRTQNNPSLSGLLFEHKKSDLATAPATASSSASSYVCYRHRHMNLYRCRIFSRLLTGLSVGNLLWLGSLDVFLGCVGASWVTILIKNKDPVSESIPAPFFNHVQPPVSLPADLARSALCSISGDNKFTVFPLFMCYVRGVVQGDTAKVPYSYRALDCMFLRRVQGFEEIHYLSLPSREVVYLVISDSYLRRVPGFFAEKDLSLPTRVNYSLNFVIFPLSLISWVVVCVLMNVFVKSIRKNLHRVVDLVSPIQTLLHVCGMFTVTVTFRLPGQWCWIMVTRDSGYKRFWLQKILVTRDPGYLRKSLYVTSCLLLCVCLVL